MQRYEHRVITVSSEEELQRCLENVEQDGWECAGVMTSPQSIGLVLKKLRPAVGVLETDVGSGKSGL
jgi:hypothetical protein